MTLEDTNCIFFIIKKQTQMVHSHDDKFLMLFFFFFYVFKRNRECVSEEGEAWSRVKKPPLLWKSLKITESES